MVAHSPGPSKSGRTTSVEVGVGLFPERYTAPASRSQPSLPNSTAPPSQTVDTSFHQSQGNRAEDEFSRLLERAQEGDSEAMGILLSDLQKYLLKLAEQEWPQALRRRESPSELVQQALFRVAKGAPRFRGEPQQWRSWAAKILRNRIVQRQRFHWALCRNPALEVPIPKMGPESSAEIALASEETGPLSRMGREELRFVMQQTLDSLPQQDREVLQWRILEGLSWSVLGERLGVTDKWAKTLFGRALRAFSAELKSVVRTLSSNRPDKQGGI